MKHLGNAFRGSGLAAMAAALLAGGCSTPYPPEELEETGFLNAPPRLNREITPNELEAKPNAVVEALELGDEYRDLAHAALFREKNWPKAYWYGEEAKRYYRHVIAQMEPNNAYALVNLGYIPLMLSRAPGLSEKDRGLLQGEARAKFNEAEKSRKGYGAAITYLGEMYALQGKWSEAEEKFESLEAAGMADAYVEDWWGYTLLQQGEGEDAREHFMKASDIGNPHEAATWAREKL